MSVINRVTLSMLVLLACLSLAACGGSNGSGSLDSPVGGNAGGANNAGGGSGGSGGGGGSTPGTGSNLTVVVAVIDSLMPSDISVANTPNLTSLISQGTLYEESRAVFAAETIPNHVAMMTGVYPNRNGIPANSFWDSDLFPNTPDDINISNPKELTANTLFTWIDRKCPDLTTGAAVSKKYLFEVFCGDDPRPSSALDCIDDGGEFANDNPRVFNVQPNVYWDPTQDPLYVPDPSEHTLDAGTMAQARSQMPQVDFLFVSMGDVDRGAHVGGEALRTAALADADTQLSLLIGDLMDAGRWQNTVMIITSDHGMDFSTISLDRISIQGALDGLAACGYEPMLAIPEGGTAGITVTNLSATEVDRQTALRAARACLLDPDGTACTTIETNCGLGSDFGPTVISDDIPPPTEPILAGWYRVPDAQDVDGTMPVSIESSHPNFGGLRLIAADGLKFAESPASAIPGNHGHFETFHNTMIVTGGASFLNQGVSVAPSVANPGPLDRLPEQSENIDVAATVAWLLGLGIQNNEFPDFTAGETGGFDGRILTEAFSQFSSDPNAPSPTSCGVLP